MLSPERFTNVTNGIAYRRWLCQSNPALTEFLCDTIGPEFLKDATALEKLLDFKEDATVHAELLRIKRENKCRLAELIASKNGVAVSPDSLFDIQIKRLHEYKRQLLNVLQILAMYRYIKTHPAEDFVPRTFVFGAKASAGYDMAKQIISLICAVSEFLASDPAVNDKLKVVFLEDYRVSMAEIIIPAAEISQQISIAGKEASGTGNMKLMINGALTMGTLDGANVEICQQVGKENMFLFGMTVEEVNALWAKGYHPQEFVAADPELSEVLDMLTSGVLGKTFPDIAASLLTDRFGVADRYMAIADFADYRRAQSDAGKAFLDRSRWAKMSLVNIAKAGIFSADRAVLEYTDRIWKM